jgi:hypothetical protein
MEKTYLALLALLLLPVIVDFFFFFIMIKGATSTMTTTKTLVTSCQTACWPYLTNAMSTAINGSNKPIIVVDAPARIPAPASTSSIKFCLFYIRSELLFRINYYYYKFIKCNFYFGNVLSCSVVSFAFRTSTLVLEFHSLAL